ncbi:MAG: hypothetical protein HYU66_16050, partial [Armatimonadetes bacterium]|nr:hypothetical protein [Armatimonadota bacterium]
MTIPCVWLTLALAACVANPRYQFDMASETSPVPDGFTRVTPKTLLKSSPEFGWVSPPRGAIYRNDPLNPLYDTHRSAQVLALYSSNVFSLGDNTFDFAVEPGRYSVTVVVGDPELGVTTSGLTISFNGQVVAEGVATTGAIKIVSAVADAPQGRIAVRCQAPTAQAYVQIAAITATPIGQEDTVSTAVQTLPDTAATREAYGRNWSGYIDAWLADWQQSRTELSAEGVDLAYVGKLVADRRRAAAPSEYWAYGLGNPQWDRTAATYGKPDLSRFCAGLRELGIDGVVTRSPLVIEELHAAGLKHAVNGSAEKLPQDIAAKVTPNVFRGLDGKPVTKPGVFSICAADVVAAFQNMWRRDIGAAADGADFFMVDEPRGMMCYGGQYGDNSDAADAAFRRWAADHHYDDLAESGIPPRGRTMAFYRFYQFRLDAVPAFVAAFIQDTPLAHVTPMPGNGNTGPATMNHTCLWPPAVARRGFTTASWAYDDPASAKMHAEVIRMAAEFGGQSAIFPPLIMDQDTPEKDQAIGTACISALTNRVMPWNFGAPTQAANRVAWLKNVWRAAALTHVLSGLRRRPPLHVWCPESLAFPDLVDLGGHEARQWGVLWKALCTANIDYDVTNTLSLPADQVALYACEKPVLTPEEFGRLSAFVTQGGTLLYTFAGRPETPDGAELPGWDALPTARLVRVALTA